MQALKIVAEMQEAQRRATKIVAAMLEMGHKDRGWNIEEPPNRAIMIAAEMLKSARRAAVRGGFFKADEPPSRGRLYLEIGWGEFVFVQGMG